MVVPVDAQNGVRQYVWDNVTTQFSYPYILEGDSLYANLYDSNGAFVQLIPDSAYTLSAEFDSGILTITDGLVLAVDADLIILERIEDLSQELDLGKRDFPPEDIEQAFDKSRIIDQQQQSLSNRSVITNIVEDRQEPIELPVAVENLFLAWDDEGNIKNATTTGTTLPAVADTYIRRDNANSVYQAKTPAEVLADIGAIDATDPDYALPTITADTYLKANAGATAYESKTVTEVANDLETPLGVDTLKDQSITGRLHVRDEKASGVNGGTSVAGTQTRVLNTTVGANTITGSSLSANQITLPVGTYNIRGTAPAFRGSNTKATIYNVTGVQVIAIGNNTISSSGNDGYATNEVDIFNYTVGVETVLELRQYFQTAAATTGLGSNAPDGNVEVYSQVFIEKIGG